MLTIMFEESKKLYDEAVSRDAALSQIANQRTGSKKRVFLNIMIGIAIAGVFVIFLVSR
jgi:hypothetical protein